MSGHGGIHVTRLRAGAGAWNAERALAEAGEFSLRAFLNGKLDLTQAEAVMDLISAQTDLAARAAREQLSGSLGKAVAEVRETIINLTAHVEAFIDFPEEDISPETGQALENSFRSFGAVHRGPVRDRKAGAAAAGRSAGCDCGGTQCGEIESLECFAWL